MGYTPIQQAVRLGHTEIVKILAALVDNPNSPFDLLERTPIQHAALKEDIDIVKILVPLSIPNARPNASRWRQISQFSSEKFFNEIEKLNLLHTKLVPNCPCT